MNDQTTAGAHLSSRDKQQQQTGMDHHQRVDVSYLVKLLLQYENSPFIEDTDLVHCQQMFRLEWSIDSSGSYMCVACGRRIVVFSTGHHTHPLYFMTAVTPSPQEIVTSIECIVVEGTGNVLMILVGTSDGWLHIHHPSLENPEVMTTIHRQRVHHGPLSGIHIQDSFLSIDTVDGIVLIDVVDVLSARQWFLKGRQMPDDILPAKAFEFYTVGHRNSTHIYGHASTSSKSIYDHMMYLNSMATDVQRDRKESSEILAISAGKEPPLAWYSLAASKTRPRNILSSILAMSSRMMFGYNRKGTPLQRDDGRQHHVLEQQEIDQGYIQEEHDTRSRDTLKKNAILSSPYSNIWDDPKRECFGLTLCRSNISCKSWAACCDSLGRVLVIDVHEQSLCKMLKGYRDCQLAWIQSKAQKEPLLLIYAPKRRALEMWDVCCGKGTKIQTLSHGQVTDTGVLISCDQDSRASSTAYLFDLRTCVIDRIDVGVKNVQG